jgi:hypothetical protein
VKKSTKLVGYANDDVGSYQNAKDSVADTAGTVAATAAATAVVIGTAGTGTPIAATLLMAAGAGATARTVTTGAIEGQSYGIEDLATDASIGAVDGLATVTGMKAGTAVAQNVLRSTATNTLRQEGLQVTERTVAHMSQELLSGSTRARVAFGALEGTVDGALGGALGEGGTTAFSDGTWDQGFTAGLQRMGVNTALGGGFGAFGGALGGGVFGRKSTHLADDLVDALPLAKTGGRGGINEGEFARSGISLKQAEINALKDQGVDALGRDFSTMTESQQKQWKSSFDQSYDVAHQQGVKAERGFLSQNNAIEQDLSQTGSAKGVGSASIDGVSASALQENRIAPDKFLPPGNKAFLARSELDTLEYLSRAFDSEVKILETIAAKYDPDTAKGTINLSSELWNCGSCQGVIKQFSERFKGIEINSKAGLFQKKILQKQANIPLLYKGQ